jgi:hypothetical protein
MINIIIIITITIGPVETHKIQGKESLGLEGKMYRSNLQVIMLPPKNESSSQVSHVFFSAMKTGPDGKGDWGDGGWG